MDENTSAVFRTHVKLSAEDLPAGGGILQFGMIDDEGWLYVNGHLAGESHDWQASPCFQIGKFLHAGDNVLAVAVHNADGPGGLNKGANLMLRGQIGPCGLEAERV